MKITKTTLKRGIRTFIQTFFGALLSAGAGIEWYNVDIEKALLGVVITSIFAGLSAILMNLEKEEIL